MRALFRSSGVENRKQVFFFLLLLQNLYTVDQNDVNCRTFILSVDCCTQFQFSCQLIKLVCFTSMVCLLSGAGANAAIEPGCSSALPLPALKTNAS